MISLNVETVQDNLYIVSTISSDVGRKSQIFRVTPLDVLDKGDWNVS